MSYSYNKNGEIIHKANYKNGVRHGEAFMKGSSIFCKEALAKGERILYEKGTSNEEFLAIYKNGEIVELYFFEFGRKIERVHNNMINEVCLNSKLP